MKKIRGLVVVVALALLAAVGASACGGVETEQAGVGPQGDEPVSSTGEALVCEQYFCFLTCDCIAWKPSLLPGGSYASGGTTPASHHMKICDAINFGGHCEDFAVPAPFTGLNFASVGDWDRSASPVFHILSTKVASDVTCEYLSEQNYGGTANFNGGGYPLTTADTTSWSISSFACWWN